jgi:hypothetical protein
MVFSLFCVLIIIIIIINNNNNIIIIKGWAIWPVPSPVTAALSSVSSVSQLLSFLVDCSGVILKGSGVVAFFAGARAGSFCILLSSLV